MVTSKIWVVCNPNMCDSSNIRTPPKFNIEPENDGLEDDFPFPGGPYSQVPMFNFRGV